jgi:hypothetical protein
VVLVAALLRLPDRESVSVMTTVTTQDSRPGLTAGERIRAGDPLHAELHEFLDDEAALLDSDRLIVSAERDDLMHRTTPGSAWHDATSTWSQSALGVPNLAFFL